MNRNRLKKIFAFATILGMLLAASTTESQIIGLRGDGETQRVYSVDPTTGLQTLVATFEASSISTDLAIIGDIAYCLGSISGPLDDFGFPINETSYRYAINLVTGEVSPTEFPAGKYLVSLSAYKNKIIGLRGDGETQRVFSLDPTTGLQTLVAAFEASSISTGLAIIGDIAYCLGSVSGPLDDFGVPTSETNYRYAINLVTGGITPTGFPPEDYLVSIAARPIGGRSPIVFIPGIAGSVLQTAGGSHRWPTILPLRIRDLNLRTGLPGIRAVDVVREFDPEAEPFYNGEPIMVYGEFIEHLVHSGYHEFPLNGNPGRMTDGSLLTDEFETTPSLFLFPYDWRLSNADHASNLHQYVSDISQLHGGAKVSIVAHSMGGLLVRRYLLEFPNHNVVKNVATIGSPFWGAPVAIYRMLAGDFYGKEIAEGKLDMWNNDAITDTLPTFPSFHELLPSNAYLQNCGTAVFREESWDFDGKDGNFEDYSRMKLHAMLDKEASPDTPSRNSIGFHGYKGGRQDDWLLDDDSVSYLHISGVEFTNSTTVKVTAVSKTLLTDYIGRGIPKSVEKWNETKGPGDGTVPLLSSDRLDAYRAPTTARAILGGGNEVQHNPLMSNRRVWDLLEDFLEDGALSPSGGMPAALSMEGTSSVPTRRRINVYGAGYVTIRDSFGNENTRVNEMMSLAVPNVDIRYGGKEPWVEIECDATNNLIIEGVLLNPSIEIEVSQVNGDGNTSNFDRYRFPIPSDRWRLQLNSMGLSELHDDANGDGTFSDEEKTMPSYSGNGQSIDIIPPQITLGVSVSAEGVVFELSGSDNGQSIPSIYYSLNGGVVQPYIVPLVFSNVDRSKIQAFAEDAAGNTSGLVETAIHPDLSLDADSGGTVTLTWPIADAYVLEESAILKDGSWTPSAASVSRSGFEDSTTISIESHTRKFFRLRSRTVTK